MSKLNLITVPRNMNESSLVSYYGWPVPDNEGLAYCSDTKEHGGEGPPTKGVTGAKWLIHLNSGLALNTSARGYKKLNALLAVFNKYGAPWTQDKNALANWMSGLTTDAKEEIQWYMTEGAEGTDPNVAPVLTDIRTLPEMADGEFVLDDLLAVFQRWTPSTKLQVGGKTYAVAYDNLLVNNAKTLVQYLRVLDPKVIRDITVTGTFVPKADNPKENIGPPDDVRTTNKFDRYVFEVDFGQGLLTPASSPHGHMQISFVL